MNKYFSLPKWFKVTFITIALIFIISQIYIAMSIFKTEQQKYTVIQSDNEFEIRFYPSSTMATIQMNATSYKALANAGFRKLAGYIFGGNENNKNISMTAPVHMDIKKTNSSMSFVMPEKYNENNLPKPNDSDIKSSKSADEFIAALRFGGFTSDEKINTNIEKLKAILREKGIKQNDNFRYLGYNPPYQLFGRRNEIIVTIEWNK